MDWEIADVDDATLPLSLYVHIPWCKCPYCDFTRRTACHADQQAYVAVLLLTLDGELASRAGLVGSAAFFGGGNLESGLRADASTSC